MGNRIETRLKVNPERHPRTFALVLGVSPRLRPERLLDELELHLRAAEEAPRFPAPVVAPSRSEPAVDAGLAERGQRMLERNVGTVFQ